MFDGLPGSMYSGIGSTMLGLEMPLHPQQQQPQQNPQNPQNPQNNHQFSHPQMVAFAHHDPDHHQQNPQSIKGYSFVANKAKPQSGHLSDEDEPGFNPDDSTGDGKRKMSPWQRMKWTDSMVRLLIMAVFYIGDEVGSEGNDPTGKKKAGGLLQKKGKWKSVSRAMMEKGFYVSPQQCEDKFNDLNKRYKRVNDILGKGTACKVVENQSLLDTMDLTPKMKEEVRKLLNSKHLFFREMCAYHNSCAHSAASGASGTHHSPEVATEPTHIQQQQALQQRCFHSSDNAQNAANSSRIEAEDLKLGKGGSEDDDDYEDDDFDDDEDEEDEEEGHLQNDHGHEDDNDHDEKSSRKRPRTESFGLSLSPLMQRLNCEMTSVIQDGSKSPGEKKHWMKMRLIQLEEQQVNYQLRAFELEKQRMKWIKFSSKKEREMERTKHENERRRLENERMVLLVRQKELELLDLHHHQHQQLSSNKRSDPSSVTA